MMIPAERQDAACFLGGLVFPFAFNPFFTTLCETPLLSNSFSLFFLSSSLILFLSINYTYSTPCSTLMKKTMSALFAWRNLTLPIGILGLAHAVTRYKRVDKHGRNRGINRVTLNDFDRSVVFAGTIFEKT